MTPQELEKSYKKHKSSFHDYIDSIKKSIRVDFYSISNVTLIRNPFVTNFPKKFFSQIYKKKSKSCQFLKSSFKFYLKQFYSLFVYILSYMMYKAYYKKSKLDIRNHIAIDVFFLVDNILKENKFNENYFTNLYDVLDKKEQKYLFLPRLYGAHKNPFKLIRFFKIISNDRRNFLFEFELIDVKDFISIFVMILSYPLKTLNLLQKENSNLDILFNNELIKDIRNFGFEGFSRYIYGQNIAKKNSITKIYSWSEFQVVERCFNYGVRTNSSHIKLYGCQFYLNYEVYFNSKVDDIDFEQNTSFHEVLVNGKYYILDREWILYKKGSSLRYKNLFTFNKNTGADNILVLGSYIKADTKYMLNTISSFENILFKNHPAVNINSLGSLNSNITIVYDDIYKLFKNAQLVIGTASGTSVEAVASGISVIIIANEDGLTANPLVDYGRGKIWDIAFSKNDVKKLYNNLIEYRTNNEEEIKEIASWYKDNFFIEPTEENIVEVFEL